MKPIFYYQILISRIRCNFWYSLKKFDTRDQSRATLILIIRKTFLAPRPRQLRKTASLERPLICIANNFRSFFKISARGAWKFRFFFVCFCLNYKKCSQTCHRYKLLLLEQNGGKFAYLGPDYMANFSPG